MQQNRALKARGASPTVRSKSDVPKVLTESHPGHKSEDAAEAKADLGHPLEAQGSGSTRVVAFKYSPRQAATPAAAPLWVACVTGVTGGGRLTLLGDGFSCGRSGMV